MKEKLREWLSDMGPSKSHIFRGAVTARGKASEIEFNASSLEFKIDGKCVGFSGNNRPDDISGLNILGQELSQIPLSRFFVHVNNFCNLRCTYCYEKEVPYKDIKELRLPDHRIREVCQFIERSSRGESGVHITFFGGEPFLSFSTVKRLYKHLNSYMKNKRITASIVTNGTIMTDDNLAFLKDRNFDVMVSFDGTREYQDSQRPGSDGTSRYDVVVVNIKKLVSAGIRKVSIRITYGQNSLDLLRSIKEVAKLGVDDISFRPVIDSAPGNKWNGIREHAGKLREVIDYYFSHLVRKDPVIIDNVHEVLRRILYRIPKSDYCNWGCICSITTDGNIYPCTHFVGIPEFNMGTIRDETINRTLQTDLIRATRIEILPCHECSVKFLCGGGCRYCSHHVYSDIFREDDYCEARRELVYAVLVNLINLFQDGRWQDSSQFIHSLMTDGEKKHSCNRFV